MPQHASTDLTDLTDLTEDKRPQQQQYIKLNKHASMSASRLKISNGLVFFQKNKQHFTEILHST